MKTLMDRTDGEYREVLSRFDVVESRLDGTDKHLDRFEDRLNALDGKIDNLHEAMRVQTRWSIGILILFYSLITAMVAMVVF